MIHQELSEPQHDIVKYTPQEELQPSEPTYELQETNTELVEQVIQLTYDYLQDKRIGGLVERGVLTREVIGRSPVCADLSDVATRIAQGLNIVASREVHPGHFLTSFGSTNQLPTEDDLILCMTWGQFDSDAFLNKPHPFFGRRSDMVQLVGKAHYTEAYSAASVQYRQVAHMPKIEDGEIVGEDWLNSTSEQVQKGEVPMGTVEPGEFPKEQWKREGSIILSR